MALIPLKQTVTVYPAVGADDWGEPVFGEPYQLKCRISDSIRLVRNQQGEEVVSVGQIFFDKLTNISLSDKIVFVDENNNTREFRPISIEVKRGLNGKPIVTVVNV